MPDNILYLHNQSEISGGERSLLGLWQNLDRRRFNVFVILPQDGPLAQKAKELGVDVSFFSFPQVHPFNLFSCFKACAFLKNYCRRHAIQLIHSYGPRNNVIASWAVKRLGIPVIWHERNIPVDGEADITKKMFRLPDAVICNSRAVANRFREAKGDIPFKAHVIYNGVDLVRFFPHNRDCFLEKKLDLENKLVVGIVTNLSIRRRVEKFLEVAGLIHLQMPDVKFMIIGGEFGEASRGRGQLIRERIEQLKLENAIIMTGFQEEVIPYLSLCDVVCHVTHRDACSRSVLEAMACAKAIVAINDGGNPELIENHISGILIDGCDALQYAQEVIRMLKDSELRNSLGHAARQRVAKFFDIQTNAQATQKLYEALFNTKAV